MISSLHGRRPTYKHMYASLSVLVFCLNFVDCCGACGGGDGVEWREDESIKHTSGGRWFI